MSDLLDQMPIYFSYGLTLLIFLSLIRFYFRSRNTRKIELVNNSRERGPLIEDPEALARAEAEVANPTILDDGTELVMAARFSSQHGYSDQTLVEMISLLGQNGIPASYSKHTWATMGDSYNLKVPATERERSLNLLKTAGFNFFGA